MYMIVSQEVCIVLYDDTSVCIISICVCEAIMNKICGVFKNDVVCQDPPSLSLQSQNNSFRLATNYRKNFSILTGGGGGGDNK